MNKTRSKQIKLKLKTQSLPPTTLLRPRLDAFWSQSNWQNSDLEAIASGINPELFWNTLMKSYQGLSIEKQAKIDNFLGNWLKTQANTKYFLEKSILAAEIDSETDKIMLNWLKLAGVNITDLTKLMTPEFYRSYLCNDDVRGIVNLYVFYYIDRQQKRVRGFNFTFDRNTPWVGAVRDSIYYESRSANSAIQQLVFDQATAKNRQIRLLAPDVARVKIIEALGFNQSQNIRLPKNLVKCRAEFERYILSLPHHLDSPNFTMIEFDRLSHIGQSPEKIIQYEQDEKKEKEIAWSEKAKHPKIPAYWLS